MEWEPREKAAGLAAVVHSRAKQWIEMSHYTTIDAANNLERPPQTVTPQQLRSLSYPVSPPKRRRLNPPGGLELALLLAGRDESPAIYNPTLGVRHSPEDMLPQAQGEGLDRTGIG